MSVAIGKHEDMPSDIYHRQRDISKTSMMAFDVSPWHYEESINGLRKVSTEQQARFNKGTLFHDYFEDMILGNGSFGKKYLVGPCDDRRVKAWKEAVKMAQEENLVLVTPKDMGDVQGMFDSVMAEPDIDMRRIFENGVSECSYIWEYRDDTYEDIPIYVKVRPDWLVLKDGAIFDFKMVASGKASTNVFLKYAMDLNYHVQHALYIDGVNAIEGENTAKTFTFVCAEDTGVNLPNEKTKYLTGLRNFPPDVVNLGREKYQSILKRFALYKRDPDWYKRNPDKWELHGYPNGFYECVAPEWLLKRDRYAA